MFGGESKDSEEEQQQAGSKLMVSENLETVDDASFLEETTREGLQSLVDDKSIDNSLQEFLEVDEEDCSVPARKVVWRNGSLCNAAEKKPAGSLWGTLVTAALQREDEIDYGCGFNRIFGVESSECEDDPGIDHLLGLFEDAPSAQSSPARSRLGTSPPSKIASPIDLSMLTQRGKSLAEEIQDQVMSNSDKVSNLEAACPDWQENVAYALHQRDPDEIEEAMDKVQKSKARLARMKESYLKVMEEHETVLDVFELSLKQSRDRLLDGNGLSSPFRPGQIGGIAHGGKSGGIDMRNFVLDSNTVG